MTIEIETAVPIGLRELGVDEKWLQDRISDDPGLLGLGDLEIAGREHPQPVGGKIDFLMRNAEDEMYYEVEVMLGALDASHIIRTIEYWDIERQRRPKWGHRAVIVAEEITTRFFNILRLLNRAVPLIAIKLSAFRVNDKVVLHAVTVLDVIDETDPDAGDTFELVDRAYWEKKSPTTLTITDQVVSALRTAKVEPRLTYNRDHIALGSTGRNFCWFNPRKSTGMANIEFRMTNETRDDAMLPLQEVGIAAWPRADYVRFNITTDALTKNLPLITTRLEKAEELSR